MKSTIFLILALILQITALQAQRFQQFIEQVNALPEAQRLEAVDSFMHADHSFPFTEMDTLVAFLYQGEASSVALAGDFTQWQPSIKLTRIPATDFWYANATFEADARLDYQFVVNGSSWIIDPLNHYTCTGGFGTNSELRMPSYALPAGVTFESSIPHGTVEDTLFTSSYLGNSRIIYIYLPPGYDTTSMVYPVMLFHDGTDYLKLGAVQNILNYLIAHRQIAPLVGIFVPPVDRTAEFLGGKREAYRKFIIDEVMPAMEHRYRLDPNPDKRGMIGVSNGGNISLYIGMKNPESFGKIGAQSSNVKNNILNTFQGSEKLPLEIYLDIGKYDIASLIPLVENLASILEHKNYACQHFSFPEGHSWGNWKGHLRLPLIQFFPYPNPLFNKSQTP